MVSTYSITMQSLGVIEPRASSAVGVKISCLYVYRQDAAKRQTAGIKFTHRPKISIFALHGRLVAPIHVKFGMTKGHMGPLCQTKFRANRFTGVGTRPQKYQNFSLFSKYIYRRDEPLDRFLKFSRFLYAQVSDITVSNLT